jgi:hypothetical protein
MSPSPPSPSPPFGQSREGRECLHGGGICETQIGPAALPPQQAKTGLAGVPSPESRATPGRSQPRHARCRGQSCPESELWVIERAWPRAWAQLRKPLILF